MARYRVLIVDDQRDVRRILSSWLATLPLKIEVVDVPSAEEAMLVAHSAYDLIISDVRLPGISGLVLVSRIQKLHPDMKIMLVTGLTDPKIRQEVEAAGAEAFFYKPINMDHFLSEVERLLTTSAIVEAGVGESTQPQSAAQKPLLLVDRLEDLRRKAVMGMVAVLDKDGNVVAEAGFLQGVYAQESLPEQLARLHAAGIELSSLLGAPEPDNLFYIPGRSRHFFVASIAPSHFLVLTSEQPFQHKLAELSQWLPDSIRTLEQVLAGARVGHPTSEPVDLGVEPELEQTPLDEAGSASFTSPDSLEVELADVEVSLEEQAAVDALFDQASLKKVERTNIDEFWDSLAEESASQHVGEGAISYDDALDMGLAPE